MTPTSNQIVLRVIDALERLDIPYMLVGSYASNSYGVARSTQDADFVISLGSQTIVPLADALKPDIILDPQLAFESVTMTSRFLARHKSSPFKVELFLTTDDPHDRIRFERRQRRQFLDREAWLPTAEDVIVQKLRWFVRVRRTKDLDDARNVVSVRIGTLDLAHIRHWCDQHGSRQVFEDLLREAEEFRARP